MISYQFSVQTIEKSLIGVRWSICFTSFIKHAFQRMSSSLEHSHVVWPYLCNKNKDLLTAIENTWSDVITRLSYCNYIKLSYYVGT